MHPDSALDFGFGGGNFAHDFGNLRKKQTMANDVLTMLANAVLMFWSASLLFFAFRLLLLLLL